MASFHSKRFTPNASTSCVPSALAWLAQRYAEEAVSGAAETIATLRRHGKAVYVVTSGLLQAVAEFAGSLGLLTGADPRCEAVF